MSVNPILLDVPVPITTDRILLRHSRAGDGQDLNDALLEDWDEYAKWLPFAKKKPTVEESEENVRRSHARWILREDLRLLICDRATGQLAGSTGLHRMKWEVPTFEIGYWIRKSFLGKGYATEATNALTRYCFKQMKAKRVELKFSSKNEKSIKVAKRLGFNYEGETKNDHVSPDGAEVRDTLIYSRVNAEGLPPLEVKW